MIATVVPVTRLRRATDWWSYKLPASMHCHPGSLVVIPFRGRETLGVVWDTEKEDRKATLSISQVITPYSLVHAPHRRFIEWLAEEGVCSLSTALHQWLPPALRDLPLTKPVRGLLASHTPTETTPAQQLVLTPGKRPAVTSALKAHSLERFVSFYEEYSDPEELQHWLEVASGKKTIALGRERALFAPWQNLQQIVVQEPEDISFYHEQIPYLNLVYAATELAKATKAELIIRTRTPQPAAELLWGTSVQGFSVPTTQVNLIDLRREQLLNEEVVGAIKESISQQKGVIIVYNALDRILEKDGERVVLPGVQTISKKLAAALGMTSLPPNIHFGTRSILNEGYQNIGLCVLLSLDPLLHQEHFADQVHGWSDITHLLSYGVPCIIQTHQLGHPVAQALQENRFGEYCLSVVKTQKEQGLLPFAEAFVCSHPSEKMVNPGDNDLYEKLSKLSIAPWVVSHPFPVVIRKKEHRAILVHAPENSRVPVALRKTLASLARPWKVQRNPWFTV